MAQGVAAVLIGGFFIAKPYIFKTGGSGGGYGGGGGSSIPPVSTEQPADTAKKEGAVDVGAELKKMTEAEKRKKKQAEERRKKKAAEEKKKAEEEAKPDTSSRGYRPL